METTVSFGCTRPTEQDIEAVVAVLRSGHLRFGENCLETERRFVDFTGSAHAVTLSSCTAGLHSALLKIGVHGKKVIVPSLTFAATVNVIIHAGGVPVFADIDENTCTIDPEHTKELIDQDTAAIMPVHMFGIPCDMTRLSEISRTYGIPLVEDCAYGLGSFWDGRHVGTFGAFGSFSFQVLKNITSGEGGLTTTQEKESEEWLRAFRNHGMAIDGSTKVKCHKFPGLNYKMTDLQAALILSQLDRLASILEKKREIAYRYARLLEQVAEFEMFTLPPQARCNHTFTAVKLQTKAITASQLFQSMRERGIEIQSFIPVHLEPFYKNLSRPLLPRTEQMTQRLIALPSHLNLSSDEIETVVENLKAACVKR